MTTIKNTLLLTPLLLTSSLGFASDISRDVRGDGSDNFFELSAGLGCGKSARVNSEDDNEGCGLGLGLGWEYHWEGLFTEAIQGSYSGLNLGYQLWQDENWTLDIIAFNINGTLSTGDEIMPGMSEAERNNRLLKRDTLAINGGVRATYYWQDNIFQLRLESDYSQKHAGTQGSLLVGRAWQIRNWNIHGLTGLHWNSSRRNEYLWNVSSLEATNQFPEYESSSGLNYSLEIGATYPISEHWVSRTRAVAFLLDDAITDSPLSNSEWAGGINTSIVYVF